MSVLGGVGHYLALLIQSHRHYSGSKIKLSYSARNAAMLTSLVVGAAVGKIYGMVGLANTATTFGALYLSEKFLLDVGTQNTHARACVHAHKHTHTHTHAHAHTRTKKQFKFFDDDWFIKVFCGSVAMYYSAMWLHANPSFIVSMMRLIE